MPMVAVYVFVFDTKGRLLIQRRSADKKIGPSQWDLSAAEHLSAGEDSCAGSCSHAC
jgi:isopentenyldiphosphate isomerase